MPKLDMTLTMRARSPAADLQPGEYHFEEIDRIQLSKLLHGLRQARIVIGDIFEATNPDGNVVGLSFFIDEKHQLLLMQIIASVFPDTSAVDVAARKEGALASQNFLMKPN